MTFFCERDKEKKNFPIERFPIERMVLNDNDRFIRITGVVNDLGMHARPASRIAQIAETAKSDVWICVDRVKADAKSVIDILTLCAVKGTQITVQIADQTDKAVMDQIIDYFKSGFGEL